ncbi:DUF1933 domain-containing protein [Metallosphaera tengchongensis]|uniref:DUF1933 domain-containing protein n=1 Tax=Metallosphaera tengchongensis TaxID=1532350 RepID=A0A6N0NZK7_9CREN|nr:Trp family transcriptional regulator [Metallosphaera tengchongensis]QKR00571.1 DUF1933 domain-containing protein [Metallosphaera tengchongensis]
MPLACEVGSKEVVPAIRSIIVKELLLMGVSYSRISKMMGVSTTTISKYNYSTNPLIEMISKDEELMDDIKTLSLMVNKGSANYHHICEICHMVRKKFFTGSLRCPVDDDVLPHDG